MKSVEVNLVYHIRLAHPLASLYQGTIRLNPLMQLSFQKLDLVFWYHCGLIYIISLTTPEGLAVFSVSLNHPCTVENVFIGIDANDAMFLAGGLTFAGIFLAHSCCLQTHLAVVDYKMSMNGSRQGVFVLALQSSVMMCRRCNRCPVFVEQSLAHGVLWYHICPCVCSCRFTPYVVLRINKYSHSKTLSWSPSIDKWTEKPW